MIKEKLRAASILKQIERYKRSNESKFYKNDGFDRIIEKMYTISNAFK